MEYGEKNKSHQNRLKNSAVTRCENRFTALSSEDENGDENNSGLADGKDHTNVKCMDNECDEKVIDADDENESDDDVFEQHHVSETVDNKNTSMNNRKLASDDVKNDSNECFTERNQLNDKVSPENESDFEHSQIFFTQSVEKNDCTKLIDSDTLNDIDECYERLQSNDQIGKSNSPDSVPEIVFEEIKLDTVPVKKCNSESSPPKVDALDENV